jgi:Xaa-Pro dipeptidase
MINNDLLPEFEQRLKRARKQMIERDIDALLIYSQKRAQVRYVSGYSPNYHTNSALVLLPLKKEPILWIKFAFDLPRAKATSWIQDVRVAPYEDARALVTECAKEVRRLHLEHSRIGLVASDLAVDEMSVSLDQYIRSEMAKTQFEPASDLLNSIRLTKSDTEIRHVRRSAQLAEVVVDALRKAIKPGESDLRAVVAAEQAARREGGRCDIIISTDASRLAFPPKNAKFHRKSIITCEITIELDGYWVQVCRTFSIGRPSEAQREVFAVSRRAYQAGLAAARCGNKVAAVWHAIHESISGDGYKDWVQYGVGHGVGLDLPELYPIEHNCDATLGRNMVFIVHPGIWAPRQGAGWTGGPIVIGDGQPRSLDRPQAEIIEI